MSMNNHRPSYLEKEIHNLERLRNEKQAESTRLNVEIEGISGKIRALEVANRIISGETPDQVSMEPQLPGKRVRVAGNPWSDFDAKSIKGMTTGDMVNAFAAHSGGQVVPKLVGQIVADSGTFPRIKQADAANRVYAYCYGSDNYERVGPGIFQRKA